MKDIIKKRSILLSEDLDPSSKLIALVLMTEAKGRQSYSLPIKTMSKWLKVSVKTVRNALKDLNSKGFISITKVKGYSSEYYVGSLLENEPDT